MKKMTLADGAYIVTSIFLTFGNYLKNIAPPIENKLLIIGALEMVALVILLLIVRKQPDNNKSNPKLAFLIGVLVVSASAYVYLYNKEVTTLNDKPVVKGLLMERWASFCRGSGIPLEECEKKVIERLKDEPDTQIWTEKSVLKNQVLLMAIYSIFTISLCTTIFLLTDLQGSRKETPISRKK
jgi:hypothetical protein